LYVLAISKQKDDMFHVIGEIVVVHEVTLAAAVTNLKRIILLWRQEGDYHHSWPKVSITAVLLHRWSLHPSSCSRVWPEDDGGPRPPAPVHPEEAQLQLQLPGDPGLRPAGWEEGRQPGGGLGGLLYLGP
jgi:hypothetical protein